MSDYHPPSTFLFFSNHSKSSILHVLKRVQEGRRILRSRPCTVHEVLTKTTLYLSQYFWSVKKFPRILRTGTVWKERTSFFYFDYLTLVTKSRFMWIQWHEEGVMSDVQHRLLVKRISTKQPFIMNEPKRSNWNSINSIYSFSLSTGKEIVSDFLFPTTTFSCAWVLKNNLHLNINREYYFTLYLSNGIPYLLYPLSGLDSQTLDSKYITTYWLRYSHFLFPFRNPYQTSPSSLRTLTLFCKSFPI